MYDFETYLCIRQGSNCNLGNRVEPIKSKAHCFSGTEKWSMLEICCWMISLKDERLFGEQKYEMQNSFEAVLWQAGITVSTGVICYPLSQYKSR